MGGRVSGVGLRSSHLTASDCFAEYQPILLAQDLTTVVGLQSLLRTHDGPNDMRSLFATDDVETLTSLNHVAGQVGLRDCPPLPGDTWLMVKVDAAVGRRTVLALARAVTGTRVRQDQIIIETRFTDQGGARGAEVLATLAAARALGMRTAIAAVDGSHSLRPFLVAADVVKLDQRLLDAQCEGEAREVAAAARDGGLPLLAFGIETASDVAAAELLGAVWLQGRHLAPPSRTGRRRG